MHCFFKASEQTYEQTNQISCRGRWQQERWQMGFLIPGAKAYTKGCKYQADIKLHNYYLEMILHV